jgi:hypothetical protein
MPKGMKKKIDQAVQHHYKSNSHHPEYYDSPSDMTKKDIIEMVSDWGAMSRELGGSLNEWASKHMRGFSKDQKELINKCVDILENKGTIEGSFHGKPPKLSENAPLGSEIRYQHLTYLKTNRGWVSYDLSDREDRDLYKSDKSELESIKVASKLLNKIEKIKDSKKCTIFLGGLCEDDNKWRKEIKSLFKDSLVFIDPYDKNWDPEDNIYDELAGLLLVDYPIFYKGGYGTEKEKKFLNICKKEYKEFEDLSELKNFLKDVMKMKITSQLDKIANEIQEQDPIIAMAIDKISDVIDRNDGIKAISLFDQAIKQIVKNDKTASLGTILKEFVEVLTPGIDKFIKDLPKNSPIPPKKEIWTDPVKLEDGLKKLINDTDNPEELEGILDEIRSRIAEYYKINVGGISLADL